MFMIPVSGTNTNRYKDLATYIYLELPSLTFFKWLFITPQLHLRCNFLPEFTLNYLKALHALLNKACEAFFCGLSFVK